MTNTLSPTDPRSLFAGAVAAAGMAITAVTPEQLTLPTPCTDFDVRALLGHLLVVLDRVAILGEETEHARLLAKGLNASGQGRQFGRNFVISHGG